MNVFFLFFILISSVSANPTQLMDKRLELYKEVSPALCEAGENLSDDGLFMEVSCAFKCKDKAASQVERTSGTFIPKQLGLTPGNGSSDTNVVWGSVGIALKIWTERVCFERAVTGCKSGENIETSKIDELESGQWKLKRFPGCKEKAITLSPFDNSAGSKRISHQVSSVSPPEFGSIRQDFGEEPFASAVKKFDVNMGSFTISLMPGKINVPSKETFKKTSCQKVVKAHLCFGDCIDLSNMKSSVIKETLATNDPLGDEEMEICADPLVASLAKRNVSPSMRKQLCEDYFWDSFMKLPMSMFRACAAIRGDVQCEGF